MTDSNTDTDPDREARIRRMREHAEALEAETRAEYAKLDERTGIDREVEDELQTVRPGSDAPPRAGITPSGSGADAERG
jgi:hypothetical protein